MKTFQINQILAVKLFDFFVMYSVSNNYLMIDNVFQSYLCCHGCYL